MNQTLKTYLISSLITFLTAFLGVIALSVDTITVSTFTTGAYLGLLSAGFRAGIKACIEYMLANKPTKE